ncbi:MAG: hypothetical protein GXO80_07955 [Chlorobi bacterium]|nr:hypothetical protein [Chlorobiota bacterium]
MRYFIIIVSLFLSFNVSAQKIISGRVTKRGGGILAGVKISAKDAPSIFTLSDEHGNYKIEIPEEVTSLVFSYSGMADKTVRIKNFTDINVKLTPAQYKKFRFGTGISLGTSRFLVFAESGDTTKVVLTPVSLHADLFYRFHKNFELQTVLEDGLNFAKFVDTTAVTESVVLNRFSFSVLLNYHIKLDRTGNHSIFAGFGPQYQHISFLNAGSVGFRFQAGVNLNNYGKTTKLFLAVDVANGKFGDDNVYVPGLPYQYLSSRFGVTFIF